MGAARIESVARFDIFANPDTAERKWVPYFLDVQNDFLDGLDTRVVVPLWHPSAFSQAARNLNPLVDIQGKHYAMDPAAIGAVPIGELRRPVCNVSSQHLAIQNALDTLFGSY
jgi:toxin CcdB